jgi:hypothetical protein
MATAAAEAAATAASLVVRDMSPLSLERRAHRRPEGGGKAGQDPDSTPHISGERRQRITTHRPKTVACTKLQFSNRPNWNAF